MNRQPFKKPNESERGPNRQMVRSNYNATLAIPLLDKNNPVEWTVVIVRTAIDSA